LDDLIPEPGCFYLLDRGYLDFARLYVIQQSQAFFVIRAKSNIKCRRLYSRPADKNMDLTCDQTIVKVSLNQLLTSFSDKKFTEESCNQLLLFNL